MRKIKTKGLSEASANRTTSKLALLKAEMDRLRLKAITGGFDESFRKCGKAALPSPSSLCVGAGLGKYFLYGPKHRNTTAKEVDAFLEELLQELKRRIGDTRSRVPVDRKELDALRSKYQKLADHAHIWHQRQLRQAHRPKVVSMDKEPGRS